jgi:NAD(P)H-nitrite reductase large subunit
LGNGTVLATRYNKKHRTHLLTLEVDADIAHQVAGIVVQDAAVTAPLEETDFTYLPDNAIVCRCERVSVGQIKEFVQENEVTDLNQLKLIRAAMGACGGKTCLDLLPRVLMQAGVAKENIRPATYRPLTVEIPMKALANQGGGEQ